jgi:hypothetical protein
MSGRIVVMLVLLGALVAPAQTTNHLYPIRDGRKFGFRIFPKS